MFTILAVSVTHAEGLVYTSGTGGTYKPTFTFSNTLRFNAKNKDVVELQKTLISKGYLKTEATGYFGKLTFAAVKAFQKDNKLKDDGIVGKVTKNLLIQEINKPISNGTPQVDVSDAINPQINTVPCTASTPSSINVLSPNGGQAFAFGSTMNIQWSICNPPANSWVALQINGGGSLIQQQIPNSQTSFAWVVPNSFFGTNDYPLTLSPGSNYKITAKLFTGANGFCTGLPNPAAPCITNPPTMIVTDQSDNTFTIN